MIQRTSDRPLSIYNRKECSTMSNSSLISMRKISPNRNSPRNHAIDTITIHCYVGQASIESMAAWLCNPQAKASANYGIGSDGRIICMVDETDRSWCSSNAANDNRAITIECASDVSDPFRVNDKVYASIIALCADICKRNGIKELKWKADPSLIGCPDKQNMTAHRWFANKACPGDYLYSHFSDIANKVNIQLGAAASVYYVRKSFGNKESQIGSYTYLDNAKKACRSDYHVYDPNGKLIYTPPIFQKGIRYRMQTDLALRTEPKASAPLVQYDTIPTAKRRYFKRGGSGEALIRKGTVDKCLGEEQVGNRGVYMKLTRGWILAQYQGKNRVAKV